MKFFIALFVLFVLGCASGKKNLADFESAPDPKVYSQLEKGLKFLETEDYEQASQIFESVLVQNPTTQFDLVLTFNAAAAREGLHDCKGAAERYRRVVIAAHSKAPQLQSQALYRLSFCYECLGLDTKVIASLVDLRKHISQMPEDVIRAEMPARLAAAYARVGNASVSKRYYEQANRGLAELKVGLQSKSKFNDALARTLFFMGRLNLPDERAKLSPQAYVDNVRTLQTYLSQAVALEVPIWSEKALNQISNAYEQMWSFVDQIEDVQIRDPLRQENQERKLRLQIAQNAFRALDQLKNYQLFQEKPGGYLEKLKTIISRQEQRFQKLLVDNSVTTLQSLESQKREGLKR